MEAEDELMAYAQSMGMGFVYEKNETIENQEKIIQYSQTIEIKRKVIRKPKSPKMLEKSPGRTGRNARIGRERKLLRNDHKEKDQDKVEESD